MGFGKWFMYFGALTFLIVGLGALAVAIVPGADEWVAEQTLDATGATDTFNQFDDADELNETAVNILTDDEVGGVRTTAWILAATFLPCAALFVYIGRWFKSMQPGFDSMMQTSAQMAGNPSAVYQQYGQAPGVVTGVVPGGSPLPTGQAPVPGFNDPIQPPFG